MRCLNKIKPRGNLLFYTIIKTMWVLENDKDKKIALNNMYKKLSCSKSIALQAIVTNLQMGNVDLDGRYIKITERGSLFLKTYSEYINTLISERKLK